MKRFLCLITALLLLIGALLTGLSSCADGGSGEATSESSATAPTTEPPTTATYGYVLIENGQTKFQLVRSDTSEQHNPEIEWVRYFVTQIKDKTGVQMPIKTDWDPEDVAEYEIIVGETTREKDVAGIDRSQLGEKDFLITLQGNRLFIIGGGVEGTALAVKYFVKHYVNVDGCVSVPEDIHLLVTYTYPVESVLLDGTPLEEYRIVYENGNAMIKYAAEELRDYLYLATGKTLALTYDTAEETEKEILIGQTNRENDKALIDREGLGEEGFIIAMTDGKLVISGGEEELRGTLYGVYEFLESYIGWRFFTADTEVVLPSEKIILEDGLEDRQVPQFEFREMFTKPYFSADIAAKRRCNFAENHGFTEKQGGGFVYAGFVHTISVLAEVGDGVSEQPCLSDETIYQTVLKNVRAKLAANPDAKIISVSQNDTDKYCTCASCAAKDATAGGTPMGSLLHFVNRIARDIADEYPDVLVDTLAYWYTRKPPVGITVEDNVVIRLCSLEVCRNHALNDPNCSENVAFMQDFENWTKICDKLYVWDYVGGHIYPTAPFPDVDILRENLKVYASMGVTGFFEEGWLYSNTTQFEDLKAYLISELLWDPTMDEETYQRHITEFMTYCYGPGWENIKAWSDMIHQVTSERSALHYDLYASPSTYLNEQMLTKYLSWEEQDALWDAAEAAAEDQPTRDHIRKERVQYTYLKLSYQYPDRYLFNRDDPAEKQAYLEEARELLNDCVRFGLGYPSSTDVTKAPLQWKMSV